MESCEPCYATCPSGWIGFGRKCFHFSEDMGNWTFSQFSCMALDAHLAVFDSLEELVRKGIRNGLVVFLLNMYCLEIESLGLKHGEGSHSGRWGTCGEQWFVPFPEVIASGLSPKLLQRPVLM